MLEELLEICGKLKVDIFRNTSQVQHLLQNFEEIKTNLERLHQDIHRVEALILGHMEGEAEISIPGKELEGRFSAKAFRKTEKASFDQRDTSPQNHPSPPLEKLFQLERKLGKEEVTLPAEYTHFIQRARALSQKLDEKSWSQGQGDRLLSDCIQFLDLILMDFPLSELEALIHPILKDFIDYLENHRGYTFLPSAESKNIKDLPWKEKEDLLQCNYLAHSQPRGSIIAIWSRGVESEDGAHWGRILLSSGRAKPEIDLLFKVKNRLARYCLDCRDVSALVPKIKALNQWLFDLSDREESNRVDLLVKVVNTMDEIRDPSTWDDLVEVAMDLLKEEGIQELKVHLGDVFDELYPDTRYEKKIVFSDQPRHTILGVLKRGLVKEDGEVLQKALVLVSQGESSSSNSSNSTSDSSFQ